MPYRRAKITKRGPVTVEHFTDQAPKAPIPVPAPVLAVRSLRQAARLQAARKGSTGAPCGSPK